MPIHRNAHRRRNYKIQKFPRNSQNTIRDLRGFGIFVGKTHRSLYQTETTVISTEEDKTEKLQKHVACSYGYKVVCCYDKSMSKPFKMYRGLNSVNKFFSDIFEEEKEILEKLKQFKNTPMNLSSEGQINHKIATNCYVCECSFTIENRKVKDHCHVTGSYRGASCNTCNLGMKLTKTIPVIFHNLKGYDSHLLLPELGKFNKKNINHTQ